MEKTALVLQAFLFFFLNGSKGGFPFLVVGLVFFFGGGGTGRRVVVVFWCFLIGLPWVFFVLLLGFLCINRHSCLYQVC